MSRLEVEDNNVGQVRAVFILSSEYKKFLVLPETRGMACSGHQHKQGVS
jgi:hypothetical protein